MADARQAEAPCAATTAQASILGLVASDLQAVEAVFVRELASEIPVIRDMGRHLRESGGKRLRPALHLLACRAVGSDDPRRITLAAVFELIHTATLVHDDVIDEAPTRRGRPSLNASGGNGVTVLMGDYLYLKSVMLTLENEDLDVLRLISSVTARMIEGELIQAARSGDLSMTQAIYEDIARRKTAHLFSACCETAAMMAKAPRAVGEALFTYGINLGMAFQIVDDLLDFTADERVLGKPVLSDFREGKVTMPLIHLLQQSGASRPDIEDRLRRAIAEADLFPLSREEIKRLVRDSGGIEAARARAAFFAEAAREAARKLPASDSRDALLALPDFVLYRDK